MYKFFSFIWKSLPKAVLSINHYPGAEKTGTTHLINTQAQLQKKPCYSESATPRLDAPKQSLGAYIRGYSSLPLRDRAIIILRSAYLYRAHDIFPKLAIAAIDHGLQPSDIQLIKIGRLAEGWNNIDTLLIIAADELHYQHKISKKIWRDLSNIYAPGQLLDIMLCSGAFHLCQPPES